MRIDIDSIADEVERLSKERKVHINSDNIWLNPPICTMVAKLAERTHPYVDEDDPRYDEHYAEESRINDAVITRITVRKLLRR